MRVRDLAGSLALLAVVAGLAGACGTIVTTDPLLPVDAGTGAEGAVPNPPTDASADALPAEGGASCASLPPSCVPGVCPQGPIYGAPRTFPFAITSDATHLYWVEQTSFTDGGGVPYDGIGIGRILRQDKAAGSAAEILVTDQPMAKTIALVGDRIYWGRGGGQTELASVERGCTAPCTPTAFPVGNDTIAELEPFGTSLLVLEGLGLVRLCNPALPNCMSVRSVNHFPGITTYRGRGIAAGRLQPIVYGIDPNGLSAPFGTTPDAGTGEDVGVAPLAGDCDVVWAVRRASGGVELISLDSSGVVSRHGTKNVDVFDLATDARYLYVAMPNGGGVFAIDKQNPSAKEIRIADGNIWRVTVDDDAVYWAIHPNNGAGGIGMMKKR